jgi:hypothetical protein
MKMEDNKSGCPGERGIRPLPRNRIMRRELVRDRRLSKRELREMIEQETWRADMARHD